MDTSSLASPLSTELCAAFALLGALGLATWGLSKARGWRRLARELSEIGLAMEQSHVGERHRQLYRAFDAVREELWALSGGRPRARAALADLLPAATLLHARGMAGADEWSELREGFLDGLRRPLRLVRAAAGWAVLVGLAGTVLGFSQAIPALHEVLSDPAGNPPAIHAASEGGAGEPQAALPRVQLVLSRLRGVFLATLGGVVGALLLSAAASFGQEPALATASREVARFGSRWLVPLIEAPDTLLDDTLRHELRGYFDEVARRVELVLSPVVTRLARELEKMEGISFGFAENLASGRATIATFHSAVGQLGGAADSGVKELVNIVNSSRDFIRELTELQTQGREQLTAAARTLAGPVEALAGSAKAMDGRLEVLDRRLGDLGTSSIGISSAITEHCVENRDLRQEVSLRSVTFVQELAQVRGILDRLPDLAPGLGSAVAAGLKVEATALLAVWQEQNRQALEAQRGDAAEIAKGIEALANRLEQLETQLAPVPELLRSLLAVELKLGEDLRASAATEPSPAVVPESAGTSPERDRAAAQALADALRPGLVEVRQSIDALRAELAASRRPASPKVAKKGGKAAAISPVLEPPPPAELVVDPNQVLRELRQVLVGTGEAIERATQASERQREAIEKLERVERERQRSRWTLTQWFFGSGRERT